MDLRVQSEIHAYLLHRQLAIVMASVRLHIIVTDLTVRSEMIQNVNWLALALIAHA